MLSAVEHLVALQQRERHRLPRTLLEVHLSALSGVRISSTPGIARALLVSIPEIVPAATVLCTRIACAIRRRRPLPRIRLAEDFPPSVLPIDALTHDHHRFSARRRCADPEHGATRQFGLEIIATGALRTISGARRRRRECFGRRGLATQCVSTWVRRQGIGATPPRAPARREFGGWRCRAQPPPTPGRTRNSCDRALSHSTSFAPPRCSGRGP